LLFNFLWQRRKEVCLLKLLCVFGSLGLAIELHSLLLLLDQSGSISFHLGLSLLYP